MTPEPKRRPIKLRPPDYRVCRAEMHAMGSDGVMYHASDDQGREETEWTPCEVLLR